MMPPAAGFHVPAGQSAQASKSRQYFPAGQGSQPVWPAFVTLPGMQ
jgi:hypothetical protein